MVFLSNVSLAYENVTHINPWISGDILSFTCPPAFECSRLAALSGGVAFIDRTKCSSMLS